MTLTSEIAQQLALILQTGMPVLEACRYFMPEGTPDPEVRVIAERWQRTRALQTAINAVQGKSWTDMALEERMSFAIAKHYVELAYFLYSRNYSELEGAAKQKADTCREAIERKLAGTAGAQDPLTQFLRDINSGKIKLGVPTAPPKVN